MWRRLLVLTGIAALVALFLRRRRLPEPGVEEGTSHAEELRRKLDEARGRAEPEPGEDAPVADAGPEDLDAKRRAVHDRARAAADEMRESSSD